MRSEINGEFIDTCQVLRAATTPDGMGGQRETWSVVSSPDCDVSSAEGGDERTFPVQVISVAPYVVTLPADTDVIPADRILWRGLTLEVKAVAGPESEELERLVACRKVGE